MFCSKECVPIFQEKSTGHKKLSDVIDDQKKDLEDLKKAYANTVSEYGKGSKEAKQLASKITDLSGELSDNEKKFKEAEIPLCKALTTFSIAIFVWFAACSEDKIPLAMFSPKPYAYFNLSAPFPVAAAKSRAF